MAKLSGTHAAIAQQVERILGKDEVASSNLASSSIKNPKPFGFGFFIYLVRFEKSNAARTSTACRQLDGGNTKGLATCITQTASPFASLNNLS